MSIPYVRMSSRPDVAYPSTAHTYPSRALPRERPRSASYLVGSGVHPWRASGWSPTPSLGSRRRRRAGGTQWRPSSPVQPVGHDTKGGPGHRAAERVAWHDDTVCGASEFTLRTAHDVAVRCSSAPRTAGRPRRVGSLLAHTWPRHQARVAGPSRAAPAWLPLPSESRPGPRAASYGRRRLHASPRCRVHRRLLLARLPRALRRAEDAG